jgi:signal transduction histidine kinase
VKQDSIEWLGERLGLAVVREDECGATANAAARSLLGRDAYPSLGAFLRQVLGEGFNRIQIEEAVTRARAGARTELSAASGARVLLSQGANSRAIAVYLAARATSSVPPARATHPDIAAGVSHELANALGAIAGWARLAKQGRRVQEALDLIEMSAESAWSAAQRMLRDVRSQRDAAAESVDLSAFVDEAARLLGPKAMARNVQVRTAIVPGLRVRGDRGSAWSIVWNLAANAVEALPPGGVVELRLATSGEMAVLEVEDNGPGMSAEHRMRAFEPYFTTKPTGTGLGLALVRQAATEVGGSVALESELGRGARFTVELPLTAGTAVGMRQASAKRSSGVFYAEPLHQRILVVDDDLGLREMISTALGMRGADVVAVHDAETALAQEGSFAVAIVDLLLPAMRGDALLARLRERGSIDLGVLMTGSELPNTAAEGRPDVLLRKPFELEELFESLATAVAADRGGRGSLVG